MLQGKEWHKLLPVGT